jgi:hypothetical protein
VVAPPLDIDAAGIVIGVFDESHAISAAHTSQPAPSERRISVPVEPV